MEAGKNKSARKFKPSHFYSIIITALVMIMIGVVALLFMQGKKLADHFKEQIEFTVIIKDNVAEKDVLSLQKKLDSEPWVKSSQYISKDEAAKIFSNENQEDFKDLLDYNPLFASVNLKLNAAYTSQDSVIAIESRVMANSIVGEFYYEKQLVGLMNDNFKKIGWIVLGI
jgi:cell division transport system permease protein